MRSATSSEGPRYCSAVCTNKGGHKDAFSNEWRKALRVSRGLAAQACRPHATSTEPRVKRETRSVLCHSMVVYSMFEQSKNIAIDLQ